ncbi:MAG TPA: hypothetical protein VIF09_05980, partial [Polyangiaceae bacterium]
MSYIPRILTVLSLGVAAAGVACSGTANTDEASFGDGGSGGLNGQSSSGGAKEGGAGASCVACLTDKDCGGGVCAQFGGDSYCASTCTGGTACPSSDACTVLSSANGTQVSACVPRGGACGSGSGSGSGGTSSGSSGSGGGSGSSSGSSSSSSGGGNCGPLVPPGTASTCSSCSSSSSSCQPNGCYGGWYCNSQTSKCQAPPTGGCGGSSSGSGSGSSGSSSGTGSSSGGGINQGPAPTGSVGPTGGTVSRLYFAVVGDTRPANVDDTSGYPTSVITKIFQDMQGMSPPPTFGVSTGDYMFATPGKGNAAPQLGLYITARGNYSNLMFPAMGNHECTGYTASNCGSGT